LNTAKQCSVVGIAEKGGHFFKMNEYIKKARPIWLGFLIML